MNKPHKYCEVIKAWADGKTIQQQNISQCNGLWSNWYGVGGETPDFGSEFLKWRIKPETIKYRVALMKSETTDGYWFEVVNLHITALELEEDVFFVKWITDWIEVEI